MVGQKRQRFLPETVATDRALNRSDTSAKAICGAFDACVECSRSMSGRQIEIAIRDVGFELRGVCRTGREDRGGRDRDDFEHDPEFRFPSPCYPGRLMVKLDLLETAKLLRPNGAASIIRRHDISVRIDPCAHPMLLLRLLTL